MGRIAELFVAMAAISTIATFFGFRALARKAIRSLGRKPERPELPHDPRKGLIGNDQEWNEHNERRADELRGSRRHP